MDIQLILEFKNSFKNIIKSLLKDLKGRFLEHPAVFFFENAQFPFNKDNK